MTILVDVEEKRCPVPMHLGRLGCSLEVVRLPAGDYVSGAAAIERKTVRDLHQCIVSGRLWSQLFALKRACARPFLLVEGMQLDGGRVSSRGVRGALLSVAESGTTVVRSRDFGDSAVWISVILSRELRRERPGLRRRGRRTMVVSPAGVLATLPGLSPALAQRLLDHFGSIALLASASEEDLQHVRGIGPVKAATVRRLLWKDTH